MVSRGFYRCSIWKTPISIRLLLLLILLFNFVDATQQNASAATLQFAKISLPTNITSPVHALSPEGDTERLFILDKATGEIRIYDTATKSFKPDTFLTVSVGTGYEQGLLSMAFDPDYANSGKFFVSFIESNGTHKVVEYKVSAANPDIADAIPTQTIITIEHPDNSQNKHYGGWIDFSPTDGNLYISVGDSGQEPESTVAQQTDNKFGSVLRIDPFNDDFMSDSNNNYAIPLDNPFVGTSSDEAVWAHGLRNAWRPGFDSQTGDLFIADVGENDVEEINIGIAGANYGWPAFEGSMELNPDILTASASELTFPIYEYLHESGRGSITGGAVYHGSIDALQGQYFFADFLSGEIWSFLWDSDQKTFSSLTLWNLAFDQLGDTLENITSFGFDGNGEMFILDIGGEVYQVASASSAVPLPAALPLFGTGLAVIGFFGWRRKRKAT